MSLIKTELDARIHTSTGSKETAKAFIQTFIRRFKYDLQKNIPVKMIATNNDTILRTNKVYLPKDKCENQRNNGVVVLNKNSLRPSI